MPVIGIDLLVALDHFLGEGVVPLDERAHDPADLVLDQSPHGEQGLLEGFELVVEMSLHGGRSLFSPRLTGLVRLPLLGPVSARTALTTPARDVVLGLLLAGT